MFLPLSDAPNPRRTPLVTYAIILANLTIYLLISLPLEGQRPQPDDPALAEYVQAIRQALPENVQLQDVLGQVSSYDLYVFEHGFRPAAPQALDLLSSIFLHGGFMHLFGNMLFLWIYGDNVEYRLGWWRYLFWYLATGIAATLFYMLISPASTLPLVGASGAISGVLGFYFLWFPHNVVRVFVFLVPFLLRVVTIPARIVLGAYLFIDNVLPLVVTYGSRGGGVAYGAHIGGFVAGLLVAWIIDRREVVAPPQDYRAEAATRSPTPADAITGLIDEGDFGRAAKAYFALPANDTRGLLSPEASLALGGWLAEHGHPEAALTVYRRHLRDYPTGQSAADAHLGAGLVQLQALGQVAPAYQHFLDALDLGPAPVTAAQARAGIEAIRGQQKYRLRSYQG